MTPTSGAKSIQLSRAKNGQMVKRLPQDGLTLSQATLLEYKAGNLMNSQPVL